MVVLALCCGLLWGDIEVVVGGGGGGGGGGDAGAAADRSTLPVRYAFMHGVCAVHTSTGDRELSDLCLCVASWWLAVGVVEPSSPP